MFVRIAKPKIVLANPIITNLLDVHAHQNFIPQKSKIIEAVSYADNVINHAPKII